MTHSSLAQVSLDNIAIKREKICKYLVYLIYETPTIEIDHSICSNEKQLEKMVKMMLENSLSRWIKEVV